MAEEEVQESFQPKGKKGLLITVILLVQVIIAAALVYFILLPKFMDKKEPAATEEEKTKESAEKEKAGSETQKKELGVIHKITSLTVNPKDSMGRHYAVLDIGLEIMSEEQLDGLKKYEPIIIDRYISYLRNKTMNELATEATQSVMKADMMHMVNSLLADSVVTNIYFTKYILE